MITISEHTVDETKINKNGWCLDLGCINFSFAKELKKYCNNIICIDPNPNIDVSNIPTDIIFERIAILWDKSSVQSNYYIYNDTNGHSLLNPSGDCCSLQAVTTTVTTTINQLMEKYNITKFELIKFDIEGSEYQILEKIDWSISKQFSIEFHDFRKMNPYFPDNQKYYDLIFEKNKDKFNIVQHECTDHPGFPLGEGRNYWDSLFVEKK